MLNTPSYDIVVVGAGVFGVWTAYEVQRAGLRVALVEAYGPGHSRSSSGDESRIIRMSYGADDIYTHWAWHSLARWKEFEHPNGQQIFEQRLSLMPHQPLYHYAHLRRILSWLFCAPLLFVV